MYKYIIYKTHTGYYKWVIRQTDIKGIYMLIGHDAFFFSDSSLLRSMTFDTCMYVMNETE